MNSRISYEVRPYSAISAEFFREIWFFRRLVWLFIWRDIMVRYKKTLIGAAWYMIQPLAMMAVFTLFFAAVFRPYVLNVAYPLFAYAGLLLWQLFSRSLTLGATSLVQFQPMLSKIYFPRIIAPAAYVFGALFDFLIAGVLLLGMMAWYRVLPPVFVLLLPIPVLMTLLFSMGCGCFLAAIDARYRDVRFAVPLLIQVWMFCTPVMYPVRYVPEQWRLLYALNPMVGITEWFRWLLFGGGELPGVGLTLLTIATVLACFVLGVVIFQKVQGTLVDTL